MAYVVLQLITLVIGDIDRLMSLLVHYLLFVRLVTLVQHSVRRHHAGPADLLYATGITISLVVLPMCHCS